ncbi:MAG: Dyp-type peroxidase [Gaiellaceae bacterium]
MMLSTERREPKMGWTPPLPPEPPAPDGGLPLRDSDEIQGNILAGFSKDHQVFLFLSFTDAATGRGWLSELVPTEGPARIASTREVATFNKQFSEARRNRGGDDPERLKAIWINVSLTHAGLLKLAPNSEPDLQPFAAFRAGPVARALQLRDVDRSAPDEWVIGRPEQTIDIVLTVAADSVSDLRVEVDKMRTLAAKHGLSVVFEQRGDTLPGARAGHEHFGFRDGVSQPGIIGFDEVGEDGFKKGHPGDEMIQAGEFVLGHPRHDGQPWPHSDWMANGSFQVFRRLRQDVPGWWSQVTMRRHSLPSDDPMAEDLLAAKLVGRWRSGTPLAKAPERDNRSARDRSLDNDFNYEDDREGNKTPRFAHIRKMYPRSDAFGDNQRRILRRGIPFGRAFDPAAGRGHGVDADRGLLFNVFMASVEEQFEFLQAQWANAPDFPGVVFGDQKSDGPDPVIGEDPAGIRVAREGHEDVELDFRRFVQTSGSLYLFAPSLTTLRRLGQGAL